MEKKFLSQEQRKCPQIIHLILCQTIEECGSVVLDCGHGIDGKTLNPEVVIEEQEDGIFLALCSNCANIKKPGG